MFCFVHSLLVRYVRSVRLLLLEPVRDVSTECLYIVLVLKMFVLNLFILLTELRAGYHWRR